MKFPLSCSMLCIYFFADGKCNVCREDVGQAHKCISCQNYSHLLKCGLPVEGTEKGYGQPVTCNKCSKGQVIYSINFVTC